MYGIKHNPQEYQFSRLVRSLKVKGLEIYDYAKDRIDQGIAALEERDTFFLTIKTGRRILGEDVANLTERDYFSCGYSFFVLRELGYEKDE